MKAVRPVILKYEYGMFSPAYDILPWLALFILQICQNDYKCTVTELPPFVPNEYLFKMQTGKDKWDVYGQTVR